MRSLRLGLLATLVAVACLVSISSSSAAHAGQSAIVSAPAFTASQLSALPENDWHSVHGNLAAQNYSSLNQITTSNVSTLKPAWSTNLNGSCAVAPSCGAEGNALVYQGIMYVETGANNVFAIDGATGAHLWEYSPTWDPGFRRLAGSRAVSPWAAACSSCHSSTAASSPWT